MDYNPINKFAFVNLEQITDDDIEKLMNAKPTQGNPLVYRAGLLDAGMFILISEEEEDREQDFADYSTELKQAVVWAARQGALYMMLSEHCEEAAIK